MTEYAPFRDQEEIIGVAAELPSTLPEISGSTMRDLSKNDFEEFRLLCERNEEHFTNGGMTNIARQLKHDLEYGVPMSSRRLGVWINDTLVGFAMIQEEIDRESCVSIDYVIDSSHTRRGITRAAVSAITKYENDRGNDVIAEVETSNSPSMRLLESLGFEEEKYASRDMRISFIHYTDTVESYMRRLHI